MSFRTQLTDIVSIALQQPRVVLSPETSTATFKLSDETSETVCPKVFALSGFYCVQIKIHQITTLHPLPTQAQTYNLKFFSIGQHSGSMKLRNGKKMWIIFSGR